MTRRTSYRLHSATAGRTPCPCQPSSFGLTAHELRAEIRRLHRAGWAFWELRCRFINPREIRK